MLALATSALAFSASPALRMHTPARIAIAPQLSVIDSIKESVIPDNQDQTLRNAFGYQALGWGLAAAFIPGVLGTELFGITATASSNFMMRGLGWGNIALAGRMTRGSDSDAATTGVIWFTAWYWALGKGAASGVYAGYVGAIVTWNLAMAVIAARRNGGIWSTLTSADGKLLDEILPRDYEVTTRNIVGMQAFAWGLMGLFGSSTLFTLLGLTATPLLSALSLGNAITNLVLGGKIMGGSDDDAAANGVTFFGSWGVLAALGVGSGLLTGQYMSLVAIWNLAMAVYCATKL